MEYLVGEKRVRFNPTSMKFSLSLGKGTAASVYLINNKAYKFYHPYSNPELMTVKKIQCYQSIPTKRVLLPLQAMLDKKRNLRGCISKYIDNLGFSHLMGFSREHVLEEFNLLYQDGILLGDETVLMQDLSEENSAFHQGIYLVDVGRFQTSEETGYDVNQTISYNISSVNEYIIHELMFRGAKHFYHGNPFTLRKELICSLSSGEGIISYLERDMKDESFGQYIKRKTN